MTGFQPQPAIAPPGVWSFPEPRRHQLANGIDVVVFDLPGQHVVSAHAVFDVGLHAEKRECEGVATICARVLDEGTRVHGGEEFAELLETEGAGFGIDISLSGLQAILDVPASRLEPALELFAEALIQPALAAEDVDRHVQLRLAEIEQVLANSAQLANVSFRGSVFDASSRASRMNGGSQDTVSAITADAVQDFHRAHFGPTGTTLILAGDFATDPLALVERCFGAWTNPDQVPSDRQDPVRGPRRSLLIDRPGSVQADLRYGSFGIDRLDPRWSDISVSSYAMGGAFLSRLNAVLREDKGYTYGVRLNFGPLRSGGSFAVQGSFRTEVMGDALAITRDLITATEPFSEREVTEAVNYYTGVSPLRYATADGVADQAASQLINALGEDYVDRSLSLLRSVTPDSATAAYREIVVTDALTLVVVGDATALADPLRAAGFPDLVVIES